MCWPDLVIVDLFHADPLCVLRDEVTSLLSWFLEANSTTDMVQQANDLLKDKGVY